MRWRSDEFSIVWFCWKSSRAASVSTLVALHAIWWIARSHPATPVYKYSTRSVAVAPSALKRTENDAVDSLTTSANKDRRACIESVSLSVKIGPAFVSQVCIKYFVHLQLFAQSSAN